MNKLDDLELLKTINIFLAEKQGYASKLYYVHDQFRDMSLVYREAGDFSDINIEDGVIVLKGDYRNGQNYEDNVYYVSFIDFCDPGFINKKNEEYKNLVQKNFLESSLKIQENLNKENQKDLAEFERLKAKFGVDYGLT